MQNIDFVCDTEDCIYWADGVCCKGTSVKIEEHHCVDYEEQVVSNRNFASDARMKEIANKAIDYFGESLTGQHLYECLTGVLGMTNEEILAADFTTLKCYMEDDTDD